MIKKRPWSDADDMKQTQCQKLVVRENSHYTKTSEHKMQ